MTFLLKELIARTDDYFCGNNFFSNNEVPITHFDIIINLDYFFINPVKGLINDSIFFCFDKLQIGCSYWRKFLAF